jgi:hypothetical protein
MIDVTHQISSVDRRVGSRKRWADASSAAGTDAAEAQAAAARVTDAYSGEPAA